LIEVNENLKKEIMSINLNFEMK